MSLSVIIPQLFLPQDSVKLGRFITSIDHPHQGYHDPSWTEAPEPIVTIREAFTGSNLQQNDTGFTSALTAFLSVGFSKRAKAEVDITADHVRTHLLDNSDEWFVKATEFLATKTWIERQVDRDNDIFMIVGFHTVTNAHIAQKVVSGTSAHGKTRIPIGLSLAALGPLGSVFKPSVQGSNDRVDDVRTAFTAPGEQICALQYRKIQHRWLSSRNADTMRLSKSPRWTSVEKGRDEEEDEDDVIEVESAPILEEALDGKWDRVNVSGSETILMRTE
ncbi:unnamed protein product [Clonostachys rosea]|uniref:Uncharacterized protein n=1 Tax=Bionectria ochroleuca TaxID=29856 RepID=A0ABY6U0K3_BIOOC|nr:unnamed protein product [Clonostachys rosea]